MAGSVVVSNDHDLKIPIKWMDDVGNVAPLTVGTTVTSDTPAVISAVDVDPSGTFCVARVAGDGVAKLTITNGGLTDVITVTVQEPTPTSVQLDAADATPVARGAPA